MTSTWSLQLVTLRTSHLFQQMSMEMVGGSIEILIARDSRQGSINRDKDMKRSNMQSNMD